MLRPLLVAAAALTAGVVLWTTMGSRGGGAAARALEAPKVQAAAPGSSAPAPSAEAFAPAPSASVEPVARPPAVVDMTPDVPRAKGTLEEAVAAAREERKFAWSFYRRLSAPDVNFVCSPYSVSSVFALLTAGAAGRTLAQIQHAFHFARDLGVHHRRRNALDQHLQSRNHETTTEERRQTLRVLNDAWMQAGVKPSAGFLDALATYYGGGLHSADFAGRLEECVATINEHVRDGTNGLIPEVLRPNTLSPATSVVLTNTVYLKTRWDSPFSEASTESEPFFALDGEKQTVPMMRRTARYRYASTPGAAVLVLPYVDEELELVVVLPHKGTFQRFVAGINERTMERILAGPFKTRKVDVRLPRFRVRFEGMAKQALIESGVVDAFDGTKANFTPMNAPLFVDDVIHSAVFALDEKGTEAAAVTVVMMQLASIDGETPVPFTVDRPFLFVLRDAATGAVLFMGHVVRWEE